MMAYNQCLNMKFDKLILEVEGLKNMLKEKERETLENNETIQMDDNYNEGEGDRNNSNDRGKVDRDENNQQIDFLFISILLFMNSSVY